MVIFLCILNSFSLFRMYAIAFANNATALSFHIHHYHICVSILVKVICQSVHFLESTKINMYCCQNGFLISFFINLQTPRQIENAIYILDTYSIIVFGCCVDNAGTYRVIFINGADVSSRQEVRTTWVFRDIYNDSNFSLVERIIAVVRLNSELKYRKK